MNAIEALISTITLFSIIYVLTKYSWLILKAIIKDVRIK